MPGSVYRLEAFFIVAEVEPGSNLYYEKADRGQFSFAELYVLSQDRVGIKHTEKQPYTEDL